MYRRLEEEGLSLCWLVGAARIYICHASLSVHNYCWGLLCIVCSAIADIATCIPTFFVLLHTQVQSLSRWSAVVHTSCHKNHKWSGRPTPFRCSGGTGSSSGWSRIWERGLNIGPQQTDLTSLTPLPPPLLACILLLTDPHRLSHSITAHFCVVLGCSYSILVQYATEEGCYWNIKQNNYSSYSAFIRIVFSAHELIIFLLCYNQWCQNMVCALVFQLVF